MKLTKRQKENLKKEGIKTVVMIITMAIVLAIIIPVAKYELKKAFEIGLIGKQKKV